MRRCLQAFGPLLATLALLGCAPKIPFVTPDMARSMLIDLEAGHTVLDCEINCSWAWIRAQRELRLLHDQQNWAQLGVRVSQIGIQMDLAYYYLGRSAEGLGAYAAAVTYYRIAGGLATGRLNFPKCGSTDCYGFRLPQDLLPRIRAALSNLATQSYAAARPGPIVKPEPAPRREPLPPIERPAPAPIERPAPAPKPPDETPWIMAPPVDPSRRLPPV